MISAFGVEHGEVSKRRQYVQTYTKKTKRQKRIERARNAAGGALGGIGLAGTRAAAVNMKGGGKVKPALVTMGGIGAALGAAKKVQPYKEHKMVPRKKV